MERERPGGDKVEMIERKREKKKNRVEGKNEKGLGKAGEMREKKKIERGGGRYKCIIYIN